MAVNWAPEMSFDVLNSALDFAIIHDAAGSNHAYRDNHRGQRRKSFDLVMVLPPDEGQFEVRLWSGHLPRRTRLNALQCRRGGCVPSNEARTRSPKSCRAVRNLRRVATIVPARTPRRPRTRKGI